MKTFFFQTIQAICHKNKGKIKLHIKYANNYYANTNKK